MKSFISISQNFSISANIFLGFFLKGKIFVSAEGNKTLHLGFEGSLTVKVVKLWGVRKMEKEKQKEWILSNSKVCKRCKQSYDPNSNTSTSCRFHTSFFVCRRHDDQKRYPFYQFDLSFLKLQFLFTILSNSFFPSFF